MHRRQFALAVTALALLVVGGVAVTFTPREPTGPRPGDGITPAAVAAVKQGMTRAEVEALMGCPPGFYAPKGTQYKVTCLGSKGLERVSWIGLKAGLMVDFDVSGPRGKVLVTNRVSEAPTPSFSARFRRLWEAYRPW